MTLRAIQGIKNKNSGQIFILINTLPEEKMRIINPEGKVLIVPGGLFHAPFLVSSSDLSSNFTSAQLSAINNLPNENRKPRTQTASRSGTSRSSRVTAPVRKSGIGATWFSQQLTFYKHQIEPLSDAQSFVVEIESVGAFKITKEEFLRVFNDVVISRDYWQNGSFSYPNLPEKALRFINPTH